MMIEVEHIIEDIIGRRRIDEEISHEIWDPIKDKEVNLEIVERIEKTEEDQEIEQTQEIGVNQVVGVVNVNPVKN